MRATISHEVMFHLDDDSERPLVPTRWRNRHARLDGVIVYLRAGQEPRIHASGRLCRKDGSPDERHRGNAPLTAVVVDPDEWIAKAKRVLSDEAIDLVLDDELARAFAALEYQAELSERP